MSNKPNLKGLALTPETLTTLAEAQSRVEAGKESDPQVIEAIKAIDLASKVVNTIMSGNQIDPVFFKQLTEVTERQMLGPKVPIKIRKKVKKKRKLKRKA